MVRPTEGEIVAKKFFEAGYQAFVLTYTTNMFWIVPLNEMWVHSPPLGAQGNFKRKEKHDTM